MPVLQGLSSVADSDPAFSNQHIQTALSNATIGWVNINKELLTKTASDEILTDEQKNLIYDALNSVSYLYIGRYFLDLDSHTANIINGSLGEPDPTDGGTGTFLEHITLIDGIQSLYESLYSTNTVSTGKAVDDFVGSLRGILLNNIESVKNALTFIDNTSSSSQTDYQTALQDLINFIDTLEDSTSFDTSIFNSLLSAVETTASAFHVALSTGYFEPKKQDLITARENILTQITNETNNLGTIKTYVNSLSNIVSYQNLTGNNTITDLIVTSSTNQKWKDYFGNYSTRFNHINPLFDTLQSEEEKINEALRLKGLPDVTQYLDLDRVAQKALRDVRINTRIEDGGKTSEQIIKESCVLLGINIIGKSSYSQSNHLLKNLNDHDRDVVKQELTSHNTVNTNS